MPIHDSVKGKSPSKPRYWSPLAHTCVLFIVENPAYCGKSETKTAEISRYKCTVFPIPIDTQIRQ